MLEYDVGFDDEGKVAALKIRGYFLCGAEMNLGFNDMAVLAMAVDQVHTDHSHCGHARWRLSVRACCSQTLEVAELPYSSALA